MNIRADAVSETKGNQRRRCKGWRSVERFGPALVPNRKLTMEETNTVMVPMEPDSVSSLSGGMFNQMVRLGEPKTGSCRGWVSVAREHRKGPSR